MKKMFDVGRQLKNGTLQKSKTITPYLVKRRFVLVQLPSQRGTGKGLER
jgi:hypothetical protein